MPSSSLLRQFDELLAYFNRRVMDVPAGFFDRNARFTLNGVPFETLLGRSDDDPLVRMIARGAAGYRFAAKPLLHALDTVLVARLAFDEEGTRARGRVALRGMLRRTGEVLDEMVSIDFVLTEARGVGHADVLISDSALEKIRAARNT